MFNLFKKKKKESSRLVGLDIALKISGFVTGRHLHYGLWDKLDVNLDNLGKHRKLIQIFYLIYTRKKK